MSQDTPTVDPLRFALSPWAFTGDEIALVRKRLEEAMRAALSATQPAQAAQPCGMKYCPKWTKGENGAIYQESSFACGSCGYVGKHDTHPGCVDTPPAPAQPAQAAQSPYAWAVSGLTNLFTGPHAEYDARQEAKHCGGTAEAFPLFRDAQAQPSGDVVRDAERYRFLAAHCRSIGEHWGGRWSIVIDGPVPKTHDSEDDFDAAIDAAIAASGRKS